jgi:SAM-dependent methyltransferase
MNSAATPVFGHLTTLSDPLRVRLLLVLEGQELPVSDLCDVLQLPQSTVSRHLKTLADDAWVASRRDGTSRLYSLMLDDLSPASRGLWTLVREQMADTPAARQDARRLASVLDARRAKSQAFFSSSAGQWDRLRDDLFGQTFHLHGLLGLLDDRWTVADLGCGTGRTADVLAPFVTRVIAVDASEEMLAAARERLAAHHNVDVRLGTLEALPLKDASVDAAHLGLVLHHIADPATVLGEASRVLRPGGRLLGRYLRAAQFTGLRVRALPPDPRAKGPTLFVASARREDPVPE